MTTGKKFPKKLFGTQIQAIQSQDRQHQYAHHSDDNMLILNLKQKIQIIFAINLEAKLFYKKVI